MQANREPKYGAVVLVDTHTHAVSADTHRFPQRPTAFANGAWWQGDDCSFERLRDEVAASSVDRVILVQAAGAYGDDNSYLDDSLQTSESGFSGVGIIDPFSRPGTSPNQRVRELAEQHRIGGLRLFYIPQPDTSWLGEAPGDELIDTCAELDLAVSVCCQPPAFDELASQLARRPDVPFALDHCGFADFTGDSPYLAAEPLWNLSDYPNLVVKLTPTLVRLNDANPSALVGELVANFGADRIIWGSDWPQHREVDEHGQQLTYAQQVDLIQSWITDLDPQQKQAIAGDNAQRLWPQLFTNLGAP